LDVAFFGPLKVFYNDACRTYIRRNPGKGLNKVAFGAIFAEAWNRAATVGNAISGFKTCGIFPFNRNHLPEHVSPPPTRAVYVHSEASDKTTPETQELHMTPSPAPTARRSFEDVSPIPSTSQTKKRKTGKSKMLTDPKFIQKLKDRKTSAAGRNKGYAKRHISNRARHANHGADDICWECRKVYKYGECWVQCLDCLHWYHVSCEQNGNDPYFVCHSCLSDKSD
jgi:hypothetical protein